MSDSAARQHMSRPISRPHTTMTGFLTHHVGPSVLKAHKGASTRTNKAAMSTDKYRGHIGKYESHINGAGNRH